MASLAVGFKLTFQRAANWNKQERNVSPVTYHLFFKQSLYFQISFKYHIDFKKFLWEHLFEALQKK